MFNIAQSTTCSVCKTQMDPYSHQPDDNPVCDACGGGIVGRRVLAFLIDVITWQVFLIVVFTPLDLAGFPETALNGINWIVAFLFPFKDGFSGRSPGKALLGLRVINTATGEPADFIDSFRRNIPLIIPILPIVIAFQLRKGKRLGDGWANTRVVRNRRQAIAASS